MNPQSAILPIGTFIRVRADYPTTRAGKDGMVVDNTSDGPVLVFGTDRHNMLQQCFCVGPEQWMPDELDYATVDAPSHLN